MLTKVAYGVDAYVKNVSTIVTYGGERVNEFFHTLYVQVWQHNPSVEQGATDCPCKHSPLASI